MGFDKEALLAAWRADQRIDGSPAVLVDPPDDLGRSGMGPLWPPFVQAKYQLAPDRAGTQVAIARLARFELLSLAARLTIGDATLGAEGKPPSNVTGLRTDRAFPLIDVDDLAGAIAEIVEETAQAHGPRPRRGSINISIGRKAALRVGPGSLQIVGCRIGKKDGSKPPLRLDGGQLPFSLRLIGCVVDSPLILSNCELVSLDLSGSAIHGLDASLLRASGSVRLRRSVLFSPADFSGARIHGFFDASDCVALCREPTPISQAFAADRGVLNLSQATIENELYLSRARIWGGLTLKGARVDRSIFMDDAIVHSPVGFLERQICEQAKRIPAQHRDADKLRQIADLCAQEDTLATRLHGPQRHDLIAAETFRSVAYRDPSDTALYQLLSESVRARGSAIRADGIQVGGSLFARGLRASGRVRLKYARVVGGLHLHGSWMRSVEATKQLLDYVRQNLKQGASHKIVRELFDTWEETKRFADRMERAENDDFALDLREAEIGGAVSLGERETHAARAPRRETAEDAAQADYGPAVLEGAFAASSVKIDGKLDLEGVDFRRPVAANVSGHGRRASHPVVVLSNAVVDDDIVFRRARGIDGVDLDNAAVSGSVVFAAKYAPPGARDVGVGVPSGEAAEGDFAWVWCRGRATGLSGDISLRGTKIGGDAILLFDPETGPDIKAELVRVAGRLDIYPTMKNGDPDRIRFNFSNFMSVGPGARTRRKHKELRALARTGREQSWLGRPSMRFIDLRNAQATIFCHPAPAWPNADGLSISGFRYERTLDIGPLATYPFPEPAKGSSSKELRAAAIFAGFGVLAWGCLLIDVTRSYLGDRTLWMFMAWTVLATFVQLARHRRSTSGESRPTAIEWLALQRVARNRYRTPGKLYWPLDPYLQAAKALREEGRYIGANLVEKERLRQRRDSLSCRHHIVAKAGMWAVDLVAGFGFNVPRTFVWLFAAMFLTAMAAQITWTRRACIEPGVPGSACAAVRASGWQPLLYTANVYMPLLEIKPEGKADGTASAQQRRADAAFAPIAWLEVLARAIGLILTGIIAAALGARAQSAFAHVRE